MKLDQIYIKNNSSSIPLPSKPNNPPPNYIQFFKFIFYASPPKSPIPNHSKIPNHSRQLNRRDKLSQSNFPYVDQLFPSRISCVTRLRRSHLEPPFRVFLLPHSHTDTPFIDLSTLSLSRALFPPFLSAPLFFALFRFLSPLSISLPLPANQASIPLHYPVTPGKS